MSATSAKPKVGINPLEDRVVIVPDDEAEAVRFGLHIPRTSKDKPTQGQLIAVGPGRFERGVRVPMDMKVGDRVLYTKYAGTTLMVEGKEVVIVKAAEVLATVD